MGRFLCPDTIVPRPGDPQSLNRYSYVRNNPVRLVDPSGNTECAASDRACWEDEWYWQNRWYNAHGYGWDGQHWGKRIEAHFQDEGILRETMAELGIQFVNINATWGFSEMVLVAQGAVALANRIGSFAQLRNLLPYGARFWRTTHALFSYLDPDYDAHAHTFPGANLVVFAHSLFQQAADFVRGTTVHELAHLIDYFNPFADGVYIHQVVPRGTHISDYAMQNYLHLEYWAEAVTDWVYGSRYLGPYSRGVREALTISQSDWIARVLRGWGW